MRGVKNQKSRRERQLTPRTTFSVGIADRRIRRGDAETAEVCELFCR